MVYCSLILIQPQDCLLKNHPEYSDPQWLSFKSDNWLLLFSPVWQKASRTSCKSLLLVYNLQICVSFLPDIFPSQVFFVFSWLPPCFQKFIWQVHERMLYLKKQKGHIQMVFLPKVMCPCLTLYFRKMLLKNNRYFVL